MIQRIQSIWLLLAAITLICMLFVPLLSKNVNNTEYHLYTNGLRMVLTDHGGNTSSITPIGAVVLDLSSVILCMAAIFQYKNRSRQKQIIVITIVLIIAAAAFCAFNAQLLPGGINGVSLNIGTFLPPLAILFCLLAIRGIRNDEQLLRSADRLR